MEHAKDVGKCDKIRLEVVPLRELLLAFYHLPLSHMPSQMIR